MVLFYDRKIYEIMINGIRLHCTCVTNYYFGKPLHNIYPSNWDKVIILLLLSCRVHCAEIVVEFLVAFDFYIVTVFP